MALTLSSTSKNYRQTHRTTETDRQTTVTMALTLSSSSKNYRDTQNDRDRQTDHSYYGTHLVKQLQELQTDTQNDRDRQTDHSHYGTHLVEQLQELANTHTCLTALFPGLPGGASTRKVKPIRILLKQETVSGSGISWAIYKSASRSRQITMPVPHHSFFTGRMPFLPPNQECESTH